MMTQLIILTGASGSGKTTILNRIQEKSYPHLSILHFDSIGIPEVAEMEKEYGSPEGWQRAKTIEWVNRIAEEYLSKSKIIFEGQMRISFILEALQLSGLSSHPVQAQIILLDCSEEVRRKRLTYDRNQPDLANDQMMNWAKYLRNEATHHGIEILDTSALSIDDCAAHLLKRFES